MPLQVQTILFPMDEWSLQECRKWLKEHGFKAAVDKKGNHYRFRQSDPKPKARYATKTLPNGIQLVLSS
jgi:predicted RNA binding protein YcfA (HicA-like mRNA interferase family)